MFNFKAMKASVLILFMSGSLYATINTDYEEAAHFDNVKRYIDLQDVVIEGNKIYVCLDQAYFQTTGIFSDANGFYIRDIKDEWVCGRCQHDNPPQRKWTCEKCQGPR